MTNAATERETTRPRTPAHFPVEDAGLAARDAWVTAAFALASGSLLLWVSSRYPFIDLDVFHQLALAREALRQGGLPSGDVWAYTPTVQKVVHHEWGTGAVLYLATVATGWGWTGLAVLRIVLVAAVAGTLFVVARRNGATPAVMVVLAPVAILLFAVGLSPVRAQLFTFLGTAVLLLCVQADRAGRRGWVVAWLAAWVLWLNLHGGFVLGAVFFGLYALERLARDLLDGCGPAGAVKRQRHLAVVGVAMALGVLANPYGWAYVAYLRHALGMERELIGEWAPLWSSEAQPVLRLLFVFGCLVAAYGLAVHRTVALPGLLPVLAAGWLAVEHQRMAPVFAVVWFAFVPAWVSGTPFGVLLGKLAARGRVPAAGLALLAAAVGFGMAAQERFWEVRVPGPGDRHGWTAPAGAVEFLRAAGFRGNLMTPFEAGSYVMWELYPAVRIGMDSRYEAAYPAGALEENVAVYRGAEGWSAVLGRTDTDAVLVRAGAPLERLLAADSAWSATYQDAGYAVYARRADR